MTRDEIIKMAKEAGAMFNYMTWVERDLAPVVERFAELVAAHEREKVAAWMMARGYATGHGDSIEDLLQELEWQISEKRGPVTFVCSTGSCRFTLTQTKLGIKDAQAIRARGEK